MSEIQKITNMMQATVKRNVGNPWGCYSYMERSGRRLGYKSRILVSLMLCPER